MDWFLFVFKRNDSEELSLLLTRFDLTELATWIVADDGDDDEDDDDDDEEEEEENIDDANERMGNLDLNREFLLLFKLNTFGAVKLLLVKLSDVDAVEDRFSDDEQAVVVLVVEGKRYVSWVLETIGAVKFWKDSVANVFSLSSSLVRFFLSNDNTKDTDDDEGGDVGKFKLAGINWIKKILSN